MKSGYLKRSQLTAQQKSLWLAAYGVGLITLIATIGLLALSGWFISAAALAGITSLASAYSFNYFGPAAIIRLFAIIRTAGRYGERLLSHHATLSLLTNLRQRLFHQLATTPSVQVASVEQMHSLTSDIEQLNEWPLKIILPYLWASSILLLTFLLWAWIAPSLLLYTIIPILLAGLILPLFTMRHTQQHTQAISHSDAERRRALLHPLEIITALSQWQQWSHFAQQFLTYSQQHQQHQDTLACFHSHLALYQQLLISFAAALMLWQGMYLKLDIPLLLACLLSLFGLAELLLTIGQQASGYGITRTALQRLNSLPSPPLPTAEANPRPEPLTHIAITNFSAQHHSTLSSNIPINFALPSGGIVWIRGTSGQGKSTLFHALAGDLAPTSGQIYLNHQPSSLATWQNLIGYLSQDITIFNLTLAENLHLAAPQASESALWTALEAVALADWAKQQPLQLDTPLGEYGTAISGGQARRIALAQLFLQDKPIWLLDEPFAGIDNSSKQHIIRNLAASGRTLIIASHQPISPLNAQEIWLMPQTKAT